ncbi:MAG: TIGR00159 family protein [bacterium]|nr:TIGR00159 family protein [bacterium]
MVEVINEILLLFNDNLLQTLKYLVYFLDITLVYFIIYKILLWITHSHVENLMKGLFLILGVYVFSSIMNLTTLHWMLEKFATVLIILIIIIFQPELRRFLERLGSSGSFFSPLLVQGELQSTTMINNILKAVDYLAKEKIGALIVIELGVNLSEYTESGISINGSVTTELLSTLFWPHTQTHDGAVIIRENKIDAAGCLLPLTGTPIRDRRVGTRHRAALGLSELTDALIIVVSEETGVISLAEEGKLTRYLTKEILETRLFKLYKESPKKSRVSIRNILNLLIQKKG